MRFISTTGQRMTGRAFLTRAVPLIVLLLFFVASSQPAMGAQIGLDDRRISDMAGLGNVNGFAADATVAFDDDTEQYFVVWAGNENPAEQNRIYGQLLNARTGAEVGSNDFEIAETPGAEDPGRDADFPEVVYNSVSNEFLVVFVGEPNGQDDGFGFILTESEVYGQRVSSNGTLLGSVFQISDCGAPGDTSADVGTLIGRPLDLAYNATDNQYLVVWRCDDVGDSGQLNGEFEISGRIVNANGTLVGAGDFQISQTGGANGTNTEYDAEGPAVAWSSSTNEYLVVWGADTPATGDGNREIYGQRISNAGAELGTNDFQVSSTIQPTRDSDVADVTYNPATGEFLVVWAGDRISDNVKRIHGQRLAYSAGNLVPVGVDDFQISDIAGAQEPSASYNSVDNEFLVSWSTGGGGQIYVQRVDANGSELATDVQISSMQFGVQFVTGIAYNPVTNAHIVAWGGGDNQDGQINGEDEIFIQMVAEPVDMAVAKGVSPSRPSPGEQVTYTITYINNGPNRILDVVLTDLVPGVLEGVSVVVSNVTGDAPVLRDGTTYIWDVARLLATEGGTITITGTVPGTINPDGTVTGAPADGTIIDNTMSIDSTAAHFDSNSANNSVTTPFTVDYPPRVVSINRVTPSPTNATSVQFLVTFSENVTGVTASNFTLPTTDDTTGVSITNITGSNDSRTVTVDTGTGDGTVGLNLVNSTGIADMGGAAKSLVGLPFIGQTYTIDKTPPEVTIDQAPGQIDPSNTSPILFTVEFSEPINVSTFTAADITLSAPAGATAAITQIAPNDDTTFEVAVSGMTTSGVVSASIDASRVTDVTGNNNNASTSVDNTVQYNLVTSYVAPAGVCAGNSPCFTTIQAGIDAVQDNGMVIVYAGSYNEIVTLARGVGLQLNGDVTLDGMLTFDDGLIDLNGQLLTVATGLTFAGTPSASSMIVDNGSGELHREIKGVGIYLFPIGETVGTPEYSPATIAFAGGDFAPGAYLSVNLTDAVFPGNTTAGATNFLTRYWTVEQSGITNFIYDVAFDYLQDDVTGDETVMLGQKWENATTGQDLDPVDDLNNWFGDTGLTDFSVFTAGDPVTLGVTLSAFEAADEGEQIRISWTTVSEFDTLGFNLWRGVSPEGPDTLLNSELIASQAPGSGEGFSYEWLDTGVESGTTYYYWLEEIDGAGVFTRHGPVSATASSPSAIGLTGLEVTAFPGVFPGGALRLAGGMLGLVVLLAAGWRVARRPVR